MWFLKNLNVFKLNNIEIIFKKSEKKINLKRSLNTYRLEYKYQN